MDKQDIVNLEKILELISEMHFKDLKGSEITAKMIILKNFAAAVAKLKEPPKPIKKKPIRKTGNKDANKQ